MHALKLMHTLKLATLAALAAAVTPLPAQTGGQATSVDPQIVLYHFFFIRAAFLQDQAAKAVASGKDGSGLGQLIQRQAGLTAQEGASVTVIAGDWKSKDTAILSVARPLAGPAAAANAAQLQQLTAQRLQNIADHLNQLQSALGQARFAVLDYYVHSTVKPRQVGKSQAAP